MKLPRNAKIFRGQLDAAPFASVTFLLLIFLLLSSKLVTTPGVRIAIDLPQVPYHVPGTTNLSVVVAVDIAGQYYYKGVSIAEDKLFTELTALVKQSKGEPLALEIRADQSGKLEKAFRLCSLAGEAGFKEALVVFKPPLVPVPAAEARPAR
jgi:biopolymer transport protein ExbD